MNSALSLCFSVSVTVSVSVFLCFSVTELYLEPYQTSIWGSFEKRVNG